MIVGTVWGGGGSESTSGWSQDAAPVLRHSRAGDSLAHWGEAGVEEFHD